MSVMRVFLLIGLMTFTQFILAGNGKVSTPGYYEAKYTTTLPVIDGMGNDTCWDKAEWAPIDQVWIGNAVDAADFTGKFKAMWTKDKLYLLVRIVDDSLRLQSPTVTDVCSNIYNYDCMELFIDENHSRETNYSGTFKSFAYHLDTAGHVCYAMGSLGWARLDNHIHYKMKRVATHTFDYEYEISVYNDTYVNGGTNTPVKLTNGKLMGWSVAYNDNDDGSTRQNMFGSIYIAGADKNISYFNASAFGELKLVGGDNTTTAMSTISGETQGLTLKTNGDKLLTVYTSDKTNIEAEFRLFDINGRQIAKMSGYKSGRCISNDLNISGLSKGIYIVKVSAGGVTETKKIVLD